MELLSPEDEEGVCFTHYQIQGSENSDIRIPENAMALAFTMSGTIAQPELLTLNKWQDSFVDWFVVQPITGML